MVLDSNNIQGLRFRTYLVFCIFGLYLGLGVAAPRQLYVRDRTRRYQLMPGDTRWYQVCHSATVPQWCEGLWYQWLSSHPHPVTITTSSVVVTSTFSDVHHILWRQWLFALLVHFLYVSEWILWAVNASFHCNIGESSYLKYLLLVHYQPRFQFICWYMLYADLSLSETVSVNSQWSCAFGTSYQLLPLLVRVYCRSDYMFVCHLCFIFVSLIFRTRATGVDMLYLVLSYCYLLR